MYQYIIYNCKFMKLKGKMNIFFDNGSFNARKGELSKDCFRQVYSFESDEQQSREELFDRFNIRRPRDYNGHSMSKGDIIVEIHNGKATAHVCLGIGWAVIDDVKVVE